MRFLNRFATPGVVLGLLIAVFILPTKTVMAATATTSVELVDGNSNTSNLRLSEQAIVTVTWDVNVTDFDDKDISITHLDDDGNPIDFSVIDWWAPGVAARYFTVVDQKTYKFDVRAPIRQWHGGWVMVTGTMIVTIRQDAVDQGNAATSLTFTFGKKCSGFLLPEKTYLRNGESMMISLSWVGSITGNKATSLNNLTYLGPPGGGLSDLRQDPMFRRHQLVTLTAPPAPASGQITIVLNENVVPEGNDSDSLTIRFGP